MEGSSCLHGLGQYQPLALAILWNQRHASIHGVMNLEAPGHGFTVQGDASGVDGVQTKDGSGNLSASRTHQAGKAQDFSGLNGKVDVIEYSCTAQACLEQSRCLFFMRRGRAAELASSGRPPSFESGPIVGSSEVPTMRRPEERSPDPPSEKFPRGGG